MRDWRAIREHSSINTIIWPPIAENRASKSAGQFCDCSRNEETTKKKQEKEKPWTHSPEYQTENMTTVNCPLMASAYAVLFNDNNLSDLRLIFPKSQTTLHVHKCIIRVASDALLAEVSDGSIKFDDEQVDEQLMTELVKSAYTFQVKLPSEEHIVPMILLAERYQFNKILPTLIEELIYTVDSNTDCLPYLKLDLSKDRYRALRNELAPLMQESDKKWLEGNTYLELGFDEWKKALQLMVNKTNEVDAYRAIHSWVRNQRDAVAAPRGEWYDTLNEIVKETSRTEPLPPSRAFDPNMCGSQLALSNNNKKLKNNNASGWKSAMGTTPCKQFTIRILSNPQHLHIGVSQRENFNKEANTNCWRLSIQNGCLYSHIGDANKPYIEQALLQGNGLVIGVKLKHGELSFSLNGEDKGVAFRGVPDDVYPTFSIHGNGGEFEFL